MTKKTFLIFLILSSLFITKSLSAAASLSFSPQRIVMTGHDRTATLRLTNRGDKTGGFRISLSDVIYQNDGTIKHTTTPPVGFPSARSFVRFSPRQVRLAPGETQQIRILLRSSRNIPNGELRIHAVLNSLPEINQEKEVVSDKGAVKAELGLSQAVAIPIIIQRGEVISNAAIASAKRSGGNIDLVLSRSGEYSAYTNINVFSGDGKTVATVLGVAVPVPNRQRTIKVKLKDGAKSPPYRIVLKDHDSGKVFAEKVVQ